MKKRKKAILIILISMILSPLWCQNLSFVDDFRVNSLDKNPANLFYNKFYDLFLFIESDGNTHTRFIYNTGFLKFSGFSYIFDSGIKKNTGLFKYQIPFFYGKNFAIAGSLNFHSFTNNWKFDLWGSIGFTYHINDCVGISGVYDNIGNVKNPYEEEKISSFLTLRLNNIFSLQGELIGFDEIREYGASLNIRPIKGLEMSIVYKNKDDNEYAGFNLSLGFDMTSAYIGYSNGIDDESNYYKIGMAMGVSTGPIIKLKKKIAKLIIKGKYNFFSSSIFSKKESLYQTVKLLEKIYADKKIETLYILIYQNNLTLSQMYQLSSIIEKIRDSGKKVVTYLADNPITFKNYFLAVQGDKVYAQPDATFMLTGIYSQTLYYKGFLNFIRIDPEVVRPDECVYKSAVEPMTNKKPSKKATENRESILRSIFDNCTDIISKRRIMNLSSLMLLINNFPIMTISEAIKFNLIDEKYYEEDFKDKFLKKAQKIKSEYRDDFYKPLPKIAIIPMKGTILQGGIFSPLLGNTITNKKYKNIFRYIEKNKTIKAVIIYVDSPGGSAFESEKIYHSLKRLEAKGKKIYVYMDNVAASGGYYISVAAGKIYATPYTITGSIGIFFAKYYIGRFFKLFKINNDTIKIGDRSDFFSPFYKWEKGDYEIMKNHLDILYKRFKMKVADGRQLEYNRVGNYARGKIYTGDQALKINLIDSILPFQDMVKEVCSENNIKYDERRVKVYDFKWNIILGLRYFTKMPNISNYNLWMLYLGD